MSQNIIEVINISKSFGSNKVLDNISFKVAPKESLVILGGSGTGKSVLIKIIVGLLTATSGEVIINKKRVNPKARDEYFDILQTIGFLFQSSALFDSFNILDNITFFANKLYKLTHQGKIDLAKNMIEKVGLSSKVLELYPQELSGGMQKRVALARAICTNPKILFLDEPTTGLDPIMSNIINELIIKIRNDLGATTITITHDMQSTSLISTDIILLHKGNIVWQGKNSELHNSGNVYLEQFINGKTDGPISTI
jgi:phospholipid/cholesterol/gamma-HCH transport system ATP-binding protein